MSKKALRALTVVSTIVFIICVASISFAVGTPGEVTITPSNAFDDVGGKILGALQGIGILVSVGVLIVLGIKYMMGSAEEKAEYKKTMIPYAIGAALIFAATTIPNMIYSFVNAN